MKRKEEAERQERLNIARNKKKQGQIKHIEKKITIGMAKIPERKDKKLKRKRKKRGTKIFIMQKRIYGP